MNEEQVRAIVREEIVKAFRSMEESAEDSQRSRWYDSGNDVEIAALGMIQNEAKLVADSLTPEKPEPRDPFAVPATGAEEWAAKIRAVIEAAVADGMDVYATSDGSGILCGPQGTNGEGHALVWEDDDV